MPMLPPWRRHVCAWGEKRAYSRTPTHAQPEELLRRRDPGVAGAPVGPSGAGRIVAQPGDYNPRGEAVAETDVGLDDVKCPLVDHGGDDDFERAVALPRALRPVARPLRVTCDGIDHQDGLPCLMRWVALLKAGRLDH